MSGRLLSARRRPLGGEPACAAPRAAVECEVETDRPPWVVLSTALCACALFAVQLRSFRRYKAVAHVDGFLPTE